VLSEKILFKEFHAGQTIVVDAIEGADGLELTFEGSRACLLRSTSKTSHPTLVTAPPYSSKGEEPHRPCLSRVRHHVAAMDRSLCRLRGVELAG